MDTLIIEYLNTYKNKDKFSPKNWEERGLKHTSNNLIQELNEKTNSCITNLIQAITNNSNRKQIKRILIYGLKELNLSYYDTEEKEFIGDVFIEISNMIEVDIKNELNELVYGKTISDLLKSSFKKKPTEKISQNCINCQKEIGILVKKINNEIPNHWMIVECGKCKELNLISLDVGIEDMVFLHLKCVDILSKEEVTRDMVIKKMKQLKV